MNTRLISTDEPRIAALEAHRGLYVSFYYSTTGEVVITDSRITANHVLTGVQFWDGEGDTTGDILADFTWVTANGSLTVNSTNVYSDGHVRLDFGWREEVEISDG